MSRPARDRCCEHCGLPLPSTLRARARFCNPSCRRASHRDRQAAQTRAQARHKTQIERVLDELRRGPVKVTDFAAPDVCDGAKPILRVAARVDELRKQGFDITSSRASNGCAIYTLASPKDGAGIAGPLAPAVTGSGADSHVLSSAVSAAPLFPADLYRPRRAHYQQENA